MPSPVITPNMSLAEPAVGGTLSPGWALLLNANFGTIDQHNHTTGLGVAIPPEGLDINSDLSFQGNNILAVNSAVFNGAVTGTPAVLSIYSNGTDLFYKDGSGNSIQLTTGGSPASGTGNIQGLPSSPIGGAGITWNNPTATFRMLLDSGTTGAGVDMGSLVLRYPGFNLTPTGSNYVVFQVPAAISAGYALTMPLALPGSQKFMTLDGSGNLAAPWSVDNSTLEIASSTTLQVKDAGITLAKMADDSVDTDQLVDGAVSNGKLGLASVTSGKIGSGEVKTANLDSNLNLPGSGVKINSAYPVLGNASDAGPVVIIAGEIDSTGTKIKGTGFTSSQTGTGNYKITFNTPLTAIYTTVVTAQQLSGAGMVVQLTSLLTTEVTWETQTSLGNSPLNGRSWFVVIGQK